MAEMAQIGSKDCREEEIVWQSPIPLKDAQRRYAVLRQNWADGLSPFVQFFFREVEDKNES